MYSYDLFKANIFKTPYLRTSDLSRTSTSMEILFDVVYVLPLQHIFNVPVSKPLHLIWFMLILINSWIGECFYNTRFDTDDIISRLVTLLNMVAIACMGFSVPASLGSNCIPFIASYCIIRGLLILKYLRAYIYIDNDKVRIVIGNILIGFGIGFILWVVSCFCDQYNQVEIKMSLYIIALLFDYGTPFYILPKMISVHEKHLPERFCCITVLVFAGNLFNFNNPNTLDISVKSFLCITLAISIPIGQVILYCSVGVGFLLKYFEKNLSFKFYTYVYLYSHVILVTAVESVSISFGHMQCTENLIEYSTALSFCISVMMIYLVMSFMCWLVGQNHRAIIRLVAAIIILLPLAFKDSSTCVVYLSVVSIVGLVQVILEYSFSTNYELLAEDEMESRLLCN